MSTFYAGTSSTSALAEVRSFFDACKSHITDDITWSFPSTGDQIESSTGTIVGSWTRAAAASVTGTAASSWTAGVGGRVRWETGAIIGGRRVRGATFLTGFGIASYENNGTLSNSAVSDITTAANALAATGSFMIWSRPGPSGSGTSVIVSGNLVDRVSWLRTRRQ